MAIDEYGVDGAYTFDPAFLSPNSQTAAFGNLLTFVVGSYGNRQNLSDADSQTYFGLSKDAFVAFYDTYAPLGFPKDQPAVQAVFTALQNAAKADPNMAMWFFNADQWNNYLLFVKSLSDTLGGTKVMLWQIPQGHVNGSATLPDRDLTDTDANFEDSATSYFFGDAFTATAGRLAHFASNQAADPGVSVTGNTVTWGEHMTAARESGALSVLFGAGLGVSTRGSPTPGGGINDKNFWYDKASAYLRGNPAPQVTLAGRGRVQVSQPDGSVKTLRVAPTRARGLQVVPLDVTGDGTPELVVTERWAGKHRMRVVDPATGRPIPGRVGRPRLLGRVTRGEGNVTAALRDVLPTFQGLDLVV